MAPTAIAVVSNKGGTGKSTMAVCLAAALVKDRPVVLVDLDQQASASSWHALRDRTDVELVVANAATLPAAVRAATRAGKTVIMDCPPHGSTVSANAVAAADLVLVPTRQGAFDLAALLDTAAMVRSKRAFSILNALIPSAKLQDSVVPFLEQNGLPVVARVVQRIAYQHAVGSGLGVTEMSDPKAKAEMEALMEAIRG